MTRLHMTFDRFSISEYENILCFHTRFCVLQSELEMESSKQRETTRFRLTWLHTHSYILLGKQKIIVYFSSSLRLI
jgi:hypothetical protein